jgi:predicted nucleic acid-binding protein
MNCVLDACALLAFLNDEEGADIIESLLNASSAETAVSMSIINLLEVYYGELRDKSSEAAQIVLDTVQYYPVTIIDKISDFIFHESARLKAAYKMSLADAVGLATAAELGAQFVSSDHHELEKVEQHEKIPFLWLPPRPHK